MALIPGLSNSLSGMKAAQSHLELVGRNITGSATPGYTRKYAQQSTQILAGNVVGVQLGSIQRDVNEGLLRSYLAANSVNGSAGAKSDYLSKTELLLGTPEGNNSVSANVSNLQKSIETFATDVTSAAGRYNLLNQAQTLTSRLNHLTSEIQKLRGDSDVQITGTIDKVNGLLDKLDSLNENIVKSNVLGYDGVADMLDQRDQALRELSGYIDISYFTRDNGELVIQTGGGVTLLDRDPHYLSHTAVAQTSPTASYAGGNITGIFVDGQDITSKIRDGELKGLIETRDTTLPSLQAQLDELAGTLKNAINEIHNQGTSYPASPSTLTGNRVFADSSRQQIKIDSGDVRFTIFDKDGKSVKTSTLVGGMNFSEGTIDEMAAAVQTWMRDEAGLDQAVVRVGEDGKLKIETGDSEYSISIMDEATSNPGSGQKNAQISFDNNGNGNFDRTHEGFSNFFGLNDFFVSNANESVYDSKVLDRNANLGVKNVVTIGFSDQTHGLNFGQISIYPSDSLDDIVNKINSDPALSDTIHASLVPNGTGYNLRIVNATGEQLEIHENRADGDPSSGLLDKLGLEPSNTGLAGSISVRDDIVRQPSLISAGIPEFNKSSGEYQLNPAANDVANNLAKAFSNSYTFKQSGNISRTETTLSNYASTFVGNVASASSNALETAKYQTELTSSIAMKEAKLSGVDMDVELANLIMFQQSYSACAQAFTASKEILDMLLQLVG